MPENDPNRKTAQEVIIENYTSEAPKSIPDLAQEHGFSKSTLQSILSRLRSSGVLPGGTGKRKSPGRPRKAVSLAEELGLTPEFSKHYLADLAQVTVLDELDELKILSQVARFGGEMARVRATGELRSRRESRGHTTGPGEPLTRAGRVRRLARLMLAVGPEVVDEAREQAFSQESGQNGQEDTAKAPESLGIEASPSDLGGRDERLDLRGADIGPDGAPNGDLPHGGLPRSEGSEGSGRSSGNQPFGGDSEMGTHDPDPDGSGDSGASH